MIVPTTQDEGITMDYTLTRKSLASMHTLARSLKKGKAAFVDTMCGDDVVNTDITFAVQDDDRRVTELCVPNGSRVDTVGCERDSLRVRFVTDDRVIAFYSDGLVTVR